MRRYALTGPVLITCLLIFFLFAFNYHSPGDVPDGKHFRGLKSEMKVKSSAGNESKQVGRSEFELLRLMDPATGEVPKGILTKTNNYVKTLPKRSQVSKFASRIATQDWEFRGPRNVGGRSRALAIDVTNSDRIIAGGVTGGMWISEDGGDTWSRTTTLESGPGATCVTQDTRTGHENTWYYGSGEYTGSGSRSVNSRRPVWRGDGMFKSIDGGLTWTQLESTTSLIEDVDSPFDAIFRVKVNPANLDEDEVFVASYGTIQRSRDGGDTWETVLGEFSVDFNNFESWTDIAISPTGVIWATLAVGIDGGGYFRSDDGGDNWVDVTPDFFPETAGRTVIEIDPSDENVIYFLSYTPQHGFNNHSFYKLDYIEGLPVYNDLSDNLPDFNEGIFGNQLNAQSGYNLVVRVHPDNQDVVYIAGTSLFRSTNGFADRTQIDWIGGYNYYYDLLPPPIGEHTHYPNHHPDVHNLIFDPNDSNIMFTSHDGGLSKTTQSLFDVDNSTPFPWVLAQGYITTQFYWVSVNPTVEGSEMVMGGMQDNGTWLNWSGDPTEDWYEMYGGDGMACAIGPSNEPGFTSFYVSTQYGGGPYRLEYDGSGEDIEFMYWASPPDMDSDRWITPFTLDPASNYSAEYIIGNDVIWRNPDMLNEENYEWDIIPGTYNDGRWITSLGVSYTDHVLYYTDYDPGRTTPSRVYRVDDALSENASPVEVSSPDFPVGGWAHCIVVDPQDNNKALVVFTNFNIPSLFYTEDGGTSWVQVGGNLEENPDGTGNGPSCYWAEIAYVNDNPIYLVGTTNGLFSTNELDGENTTWVMEGEDIIGRNWVTHMDIRYSDGFIAIGTHGAGVYTAYLEDVSVDEPAENPVPNSFVLNRAYPNPFNPSTSFSVYLPQAGKLTVEVYNELGQRVANIADNQFTSGQHNFTFDAANHASGTYFIRATSPQFGTKSQRIVLVK